MRRVGMAVGLMLILLTGVSVAQPHPDRGMHPRREHVRERVREIKMLKLMEALDLTEEQSARFFPRYREVEERIAAINEEMEELLHDLAEASAQKTDHKIDEMIRKYGELAKKHVEIRAEFINDVSDILSPQQRAALIVFERRFQDRLRNLIHEAGGGPPPGRGRGRWEP